MRTRIGWLLVLLALCLSVRANLMEQRYHEMRQVFEAREKTAQQDLKRYLQDYPYTIYHSEVQMMLGVLQTEKGRYKQALRSFDKVKWNELGRNDQPLFYFYRGYAYLQLGEMDAAIACFRPLKESENPFSLQGKYYCAYCQYRKEDYKNALPAFLELEETPQYKNTVPYYIVQIYYAQQNDAEVFARCQDLLKRDPNNVNNHELHRILGEIYYRRGDYAKTIEHLRLYRDANTGKNKEWLREDIYLLAMSEYQMADYAEALNTFKQVKQQKDTISQSTCLHLGHAYRKTGDIEKAKLSYQAAMNFTLSSVMREEAMYNYALTTYESGTALGESIKAFNDFLTEYPHTAHANEAYQLLATVYMSSKNYRAALDAVNAIPNQTDKVQQVRQYLRYQIGVDAFLQGRMQETIQWMTEVIQNDKQGSEYRADAYFYRAEAYYRSARYENCYQDVQQFVNLPHNRSKNLLQADYLLGYTLFCLKRYGEAEEAFRRFVTTQPQKNLWADAMNRIGDCCFNNRAFADAIYAYQQVVDQKTTGADYALFQVGYALGLQHQYPAKAEVMTQLAATYPKSDYADDALYEAARAYLQTNENEAAIQSYQTLMERYPQSGYARKASLEKAMAYRNIEQTEQAIRSFQQTIDLYPATEEAYAALDALEQIYVEGNRLNEYLDYTKQVSKNNMTISTEEDSLTYVTAELQYMMNNYTEAAAGMTTYITRFCPNGRYCTMAMWYAADCYYRLSNAEETIRLLQELYTNPGNPYIEETCSRLAELLYEQKDYASAREYFAHLRTIATKQQNRIASELGVLRCSYYLNDSDAVIEVASRLIDEEDIADEVRDEALYNRGKALYRAEQWGQAAVDFAPLSKNVRVVTGAEAAYLLADCYYRLKAYESAENEIMRFANQRTQHQYWLAKSLILLADINVDLGDLFQAKQYLLTLQTNYKATDDIQSIILDRLTKIEQLETAPADETQTPQEENNETEEDEL